MQALRRDLHVSSLRCTFIITTMKPGMSSRERCACKLEKMWSKREQVRYLLVMTTNIYRLIQEIHATQDRTPSVMRAVFEKYGSELVDSQPSN